MDQSSKGSFYQPDVIFIFVLQSRQFEKSYILKLTSIINMNPSTIDLLFLSCGPGGPLPDTAPELIDLTDMLIWFRPF